MGIMDLFKATENKALKEEVQKLKQVLTPEHQSILELQEQINSLNQTNCLLQNKNIELNNILFNLQQQINLKKNEIIQLDDELLFQSFSLYKPMYDFASSELYKEKLESIRNKQKYMIKNKTAVSFYDGWTVDGSKAKGRKMTNDNIKQILRCFNTDCENAIDKVKFNNIESMKNRINTSFRTLNSLNSTNRVSITIQYLNLKLEELSLAYEYQKKKQEEKEEEKRRKEELREQEKVKKEIEEARKNITKDKNHYSKALEELLITISNETDKEKLDALMEKKVDIEKHLNEIEEKLKDIDYRESNQKAGYVYVISNIGSFGPDVYKIGMTRRLEPLERIKELSDASVPFNFDVHALIFTEDAPALEYALHKAFENNRLNMVNQRREFFKVPLESIKEVILKNYDKTVEFVSIPTAEQYRESQKILENLQYK